MLGFQNAPLTRWMMITLFFGSFGASIGNMARWLRVESFREQVMLGWQWWRPWSHQLLLASSGQLFVSMLLLYSLQPHLERIMGAAKWRRYFFLCAFLCPLALCSYALVVSHDVFRSVPGPISLMTCIVSLSLRYIPMSGIDHFVVPLFSMQLAIPLMPDSLVHIIVGMLVGRLVSNHLNLK